MQSLNKSNKKKNIHRSKKHVLCLPRIQFTEGFYSKFAHYKNYGGEFYVNS